MNIDNIKSILLVVFSCLSMTVASQSQQLVITGNVSSDLEGEIIGAHVTEVDANGRIVNATITDFSGNFSLSIKSVNNKLKVSFVGYDPVEVSIKDKRRFNIKMKENAVLDEVVVTAKAMHSDGTLAIPKREVSGAMQHISMRDLEDMSVASIDDALQGRIAGFDILGNSGDLGSGSSMRIRGTTSINSKSEPLIVLNDIPFENNVDDSFDYTSADQEQFANLLNINPDDIEEITVLKDGASAAIWGSKGANGVILIKTKKGVKGPTRVQYSYRFSGAQQPRGLKMLNGDDYTMLMKQAYFNPFQDEYAANIPEFNYDPTFAEYQNFNNNTDWVKAITQYGFTHDHYATVSGGGDKATFRASLGYYSQLGTVIKQNLERFTNRMYLEYQVSDRIKFISDFSMTYTDNHKNYANDVGDGDNKENLLSMAYRKMPNVSIFQQDANGNNTDIYYNIPQSSSLDNSQKDLMNPVALANLAFNNQKNLYIVPTLRLQYDIINPEKAQLRYNGYVSFNIENTKESKFLPKEVTSKSWNDETVNRAYMKESEGLSIQSEQKITWIPRWGDNHSLLVSAVWQMNSGNSQYQEFEKYGLPSNSITDAISVGFDKAFNSGAGQWRSLAIMGRAHYTFMNRYTIDATFRRDGSTKFGSNNRWGDFPAVSLKWNMADELFMKPLRAVIDELGIRGGWGITGNQPDKEYLHFSRYNSSWGGGNNNYINIPTVKPSSIELSDLKWEKVTSYNLGIDLHLFNSKLVFDGNIYKRKTEDLLFKDLGIPSSSGFGSLSYVNIGVMDNTGWELSIYTNNLIKTRDWKVDFNVNFSNNKNKIVELSPAVLNAYNKDFNYDNGSYLTRLQEGNSFGSIYGFRYKGVYQYDKYEEGRGGTAPVVKDANGNVVKDANGKPLPMYFDYFNLGNKRYQFRGGDAIYEDINHDGTIDELDIVYLGNSNPKLTGGFGTNITFKNFSISAFFNFRYGNKIVNYARMDAENMHSNNNQSIAVNWRWRKDGDVTEMPRALYNYGYNYLGSDRFVEDGSFLRFKTLTFKYNFSPKSLRRVFLNQLSFYLTLNNLVTFTKYTGVDPEVGIESFGLCADRSKTPRSQYFTFGVTVGF